MATSGNAVSVRFEEKLKEVYPGQSFPEAPEPEFQEGGGETPKPQTPQKEDEATDDSEDDFIQPRRKRLKVDEKALHIK